MKPRLFLLAFATGLLVAQAPIAEAAPLPSDAKNLAGPTLALQAKSIDQLLDTFKTAAKNFVPDSMYKQFEKDVLTKLDPSLLKGVDSKRPSGMYATIGEGLMQGDFSKTSFVVLVPVTNEKDFVDFLGLTGLPIEKRGDVYTVPIPNFPVPASMRFLKGYAYIGIAGDKLDPKLLLDPRDVIIEKETAAVVLRIRIDRIPDELKQMALGFMAQAIDDTKRDVPPEAKDFVESLLKTFQRWTKMGVEEGKELVYRIDLDPKGGALIVETTFEAKSGAALAKSFAALKPTKNDFANLIGPDSAAHVLIQTPLFCEDVQTLLLKLVEAGAQAADKDMKKNAPREARELIEELFATLGRTVKSGNADMAATLRGPDKNGQYTAIGAFSLKETAALEKAIKTAMKVAPKDAADMIKLDVDKEGDVNIHEMVVGDKLPPEAQKIFGKSSVYWALAPNGYFVAFGAQAKAVLKEVLTSKLGPKPAPLVQMEVSGKRMMTLIKSLGAPLDGPAGDFMEKIGKMDRVAVLTIKVEGGEKLVIRQEIGVLPVAATMFLGRSANAEFKQVAPMVQPAPAIRRAPELKKEELKKVEPK